MGRVLRNDVHVTLKDNSVVVLPAGASVPAKYADYVTNPKAFVEGEDASADAPSAVADEPTGSNYAEWSNTQLKVALRKRELPQGGNKAELVERLKADDIKSDGSDDSGAADGDEPDEGDEENRE